VSVEKSIVERDGQYCVTTLDGKKTLGCHPTKEEAQRHLAAIEANKASGQACPLCEGSGKIKAGTTTCPDCHGAGTMAKATWDTAYINDLPDSAFAYIEPGGDKDGEGKTTPRSLRHLPYKDSSGKVDAPHARDGLSRLPQTDIPEGAKEKAKAKLEAALASTKATHFTLKAINDEQRLVFAWANVMVTTDGRAVEQWGMDGFNDVFPIEVMEKAAHDFMVQSREGGLMHEEGDKATVVESLVWTPAKEAALGLPAGTMPYGWLVALHVHDDATWADVKAGKLAMLSIQGAAVREPVAAGKE
jgi:hypothetical protein